MKRKSSSKIALTSAVLFFCMLGFCFPADSLSSTNLPDFLKNWIVSFSSSSGFTLVTTDLPDSLQFYHTGDKAFSITITQPLLPIWFEKSGFAWEDSYEQWLAKFSKTNAFTVDTTQPVIKKTFSSGTIIEKFLADIDALWNNDKNFLVRVHFSRSGSPDYVQITWNQNGFRQILDLKNRERPADFWESLPLEEKYICALSSNLVRLNNQSVHTLNPDPGEEENSTDSKSILKNSWSITDKQGVFTQIKSLEEGGHAGAYRKLLEIDEKYSGLSVEEVAKNECFSLYEISRFLFVRSMKTKLGKQGLEAWDKGRELLLLRWAIGSGYITQDEAMSELRRISDYLINSYSSWEDFTAHYIAGRAFYGLSDVSYGSLTEKALNASLDVMSDYPVEDLKFYGKSSSKPMQLSDAWYTPSKEALEYEKALVIENSESWENKDYILIQDILNLFPNTPCLNFLHARLSVQFDSYYNALNYYRRAYDVFNSCTEKTSLYDNFHTYYASFANSMDKPGEALEALEKLSESEKQSALSYYLKALSYSKLIGTSADYEENEDYASLAWTNFQTARELGYELPEGLLTWLSDISNKKIEDDKTK